MKIEDDVVAFKDFMRYCSLQKDGYLYGSMMMIFKDGVGVAHVEDTNMATYARIKYRPEKVDNGTFWCDPSKFIDSKIGKLRSAKIGLVKIDFGKDYIRGKCGRLTFKSDKDNKEACKKSYDGAKDWGKNFKIKSGKVVGFEDFSYPYHLEIDTSIMRDAISNKSTLTSPSHYKLVMDKDGAVSILVVDDEDKSDDPNHYAFELGNVEGDVEAIESKFRNTVGNIFTNLTGKVDIWFNQDSPLIVYKEIEMPEQGTRKLNKFELFYILIHSKKSKKEEMSEEEVLGQDGSMDDEALQQEMVDSEDEVITDATDEDIEEWKNEEGLDEDAIE
jgi:hypothetical protein